MKTLHHTIYTESRSDRFRLYYLTDMHVGAQACDENLLRETIRKIAADAIAFGEQYVPLPDWSFR